MMKFCVGQQIFDLNCEFPHISMQKRCMQMYGDMWECMGIAWRRCNFFSGDERDEMFCLGNAWGRPHANFCAWGPSPHNFLLRGADLRGFVIQGCFIMGEYIQGVKNLHFDTVKKSVFLLFIVTTTGLYGDLCL